MGLGKKEFSEKVKRVVSYLKKNNLTASDFEINQSEEILSPKEREQVRELFKENKESEGKKEESKNYNLDKLYEEKIPIDIKNGTIKDKVNILQARFLMLENQILDLVSWRESLRAFVHGVIMPEVRYVQDLRNSEIPDENPERS